MNSKKVLYVEDDLMLGKITSDSLVRNGYLVRWAKDGLKAREAIEEEFFDICVIDIMLPGVDGYTLVKEIRIKDTEVPIIFLTARSLTEDVVKGFDLGGNDYVRKPFGIEELMARMNALLKKGNKQTEDTEVNPILQIGKFNFNYHKMELSGEPGKKIKLTYLENELLHRLAIKRNQILRRQQILMELWQDDTFFNARSMDVYITKLRKHLAADPSITIMNVRGVGFKLIV